MTEFDNLVKTLEKEFPEDTSIVLETKDINHELLLEILKSYKTNSNDWQQYALYDPKKNYSRNGIADFGPNGNLLILVWMPGKSSYIHDHSNAHCCMKVLEGTLTESLYHAPDIDQEREPELTKESSLLVNEVTYINDSLGVHKISNCSNDIAVSLHLYTPPYAKLNGCNYYESANGKRHHCDMSRLYSWRGKLIDDDEMPAASCS